MITAIDVAVSFGERQVLQGVSLGVSPGVTLGIVGPNGCGKTTLLRTLYGALSPTGGSVTLNGHPMAGLARKDVAREIAVVAQEQVSDIPVTVAELVAMGRMPHQSFGGKLSEADEELIAEMLETVGLLDKATQTFSRLSGGERQRALIARALTQHAPITLLDEPTNHLDIRYQHEVMKLIAAMPGGSVTVLHDLNLAARYCSHIAVMNAGQIVARGTPDEVLVPEVLEPVYEIGIRRLDLEDGIHLVFQGS